jgi:hypothetical protein
MARREYELLTRTLMPESQGLLMSIDRLPGEYKRADLVSALSDATGKLDALIAWGVVEGYLLEGALAEAGVVPGRNLSVLLLGSTDFPSEHRNIFDVVGNSNAAKLDLFEEVILDRLHEVDRPVQTHYLPITLVRHGSCRVLSRQV